MCSFDNVSPALPASYPFGIFGNLSASWRRAYSNYSSLSVLIYAYLFILVCPGILCFQLKNMSWIAEALPGSAGYHPATWTCHRMSLCVKIKHEKNVMLYCIGVYHLIYTYIYIYIHTHYNNIYIYIEYILYVNMYIYIYMCNYVHICLDVMYAHVHRQRAASSDQTVWFSGKVRPQKPFVRLIVGLLYDFVYRNWRDTRFVWNEDKPAWF